jgi:Zn-finger nucleic acid-binding protein
MICPACGRELEPFATGGVTVDVCAHGCRGIWFDAFELQKLADINATLTQQLRAVSSATPANIETVDKRVCPKCSGVAMMRHYFSSQRRTLVDECPSCGGFWLDAGELASVRQEQIELREQGRGVHAKLSRMALEAVASRLRRGGEESQTSKPLAHSLNSMAAAIEQLKTNAE